MTIKELKDRILFYLSVPKCVLCHDKLSFNDKGLCSKCRQVYDSHKTRNCSRCSKILTKCTCTNEYLASHFVKRHLKMFRYLNNEPSSPGNYLIYSLKRDYRDDVVNILAEELAEVIKGNVVDYNSGNYLITNVPRRRKGILLYGYDHTAVLAERIAEILGIEYISVLKSNLKKPQKEMRGVGRLLNADYDYKKNIDRDLSKKRIFIVDDVVTTGASVGACAGLLKGLGAREIIAVSIATAYNDWYVKRIKTEF